MTRLFWRPLILASVVSLCPMAQAIDEDCLRRLSKAVIGAEGYNQARDLPEYLRHFYPLAMDPLIYSSTPEMHWIDLGAGRANAFRTYRNSKGGQAQLTAIAFAEPVGISPDSESRRLENSVSNSRFIEGFFSEIPNESLGQADVITDMFGVLSYTHDFSGDLQKALDLLKPNGSLYMHLGVDRFTQISTRLANTSRGPILDPNEIMSVEDFLVEAGIPVQSLDMDPDDNVTLRIQRAGDQALPRVPLLQNVKFEDNRPPVRHYYFQQ